MALMIFPVAYLAYFILFHQGQYLEFIIPVFFFGVFLSLPAFALCLIMIEPVRWVSNQTNIRFILWIMITLLCVYGGTALVLILFFDYGLYQEIGLLIRPAFIAALISVCFRKRQFTKLMNSTSEEWM